MNVGELEREVSQLPPSELKKFSQWFDEFKADQWDKQIEEDIVSGRLGSIAEHALKTGAIPFPKDLAENKFPVVGYAPRTARGLKVRSAYPTPTSR